MTTSTVKPMTASRKRFLIGILLLMLSSVAFSSKAILIKILYRDTPIDTYSILALRMLFSLPFFVAAALLQRQQKNFAPMTRREWAAVAVVGLLGYYVSSALDFLGLQYVTASVERLILYAYPTFVLLFSAIFYKTSITRTQFFALLLTYSGIALAFGAEVQLGKQKDLLHGGALIFCCAITYALYVLWSGRLIPRLGSMKFSAWAMIFASFGVWTHCAFHNGLAIFHFSAHVYWLILAMAIGETVLPVFMTAEGIGRVGASNASIVSAVGPVATIFMGYFFLGEAITFFQVLGTAVVLAGVFWISKSKA